MLQGASLSYLGLIFTLPGFFGVDGGCQGLFSSGGIVPRAPSPGQRLT